jgi:hypothetical protein
VCEVELVYFANLLENETCEDCSWAATPHSNTLVPTHSTNMVESSNLRCVNSMIGPQQLAIIAHLNNWES